MRTTADILTAIKVAAGDGRCPRGFDIFMSNEVLRTEDLHSNYTFESAVRYLMKIRPQDAANLEAETQVEP